MALVFAVMPDVVVIGCHDFSCGVPLAAYEKLIGKPSRTEMPGPPPPYGHRNNIIHFYDELGLYLHEHHSSRLIDGIEILFEPKRWLFPTTHPFSGQLTVCGVEIATGMPFANFARQCTISFKPHLGHAWYFDGEAISIQFEVHKERSEGSEPLERIVVLGIGFRGAHRVP